MYPYQEIGAEFLAATPQALLADRMGLGKSAQVIRAADNLGLDSLLIFCPANVKINWQREWARFSPMDRPCTVLMTGRDKVPAEGVVICSYDLGANEKILAQLKRRRWQAIVLDECHFLKSRSAQRTKSIYGSSVRSPGLAAHTDRIWRLSGTPAPNDASELWTHLKSAGVITDAYYDFVYKFCTGYDSDFGFRITGHKNVPELKQLLGTFMLQRKVEDVMPQLPPIQYSEVTVARSKVELDITFFEQMRGRSLPEFLNEIKTADTTLRNALAQIKPEGTPLQDRVALLTTMAKSLVTLRRYIGMAKLPNVCDILAEELASNQVEKVVVFAVHRDVIEGARLKLAKFGAVTLYGGTDPKKKQLNVDKFMNDPKCRVFIGNVQAAGTGITLTSACEVAFLEADWVPSNNAQAAMRCHRIGQTKPVRVRYFSCEGSVDEQVQQTLLRKSRELTKIF
ncbi:MAG TPA: DEAD/DEAH box helicase [Rhizobacter sp.]|nr:DEAD/DEAH box helicase [Rhizobacter sp.]